MAHPFYRPPAAREPLALRPREAAESLGVSLSTLERLTKSGELGSVSIGRCRVYEVSTLKAYLTSRRTIAEKGGDR